jgi:23S rRNA (adenine2030-N6)-methyltransferase
MLSYRHAFHAGNHADVLKHVVLVETLRYLLGKSGPLWFIDTHAGVGQYRLNPKPPAGQAEWLNGIARLWDDRTLPAALEPYLGLVRTLNPDGKLRHYPGSPRLAADLLRPGDRAWLYELQPSDFPVLEAHFRERENVHCAKADGFEALRGLLPPAPRRALVFIDPSYEVQSDYRRLLETLEDALRRFATGCYLVWYPIVQRAEALELPTRLLRLPPGAGSPSGLARWLRVELRVQAPPAGGYGLYGSGVFVINPPWTLPAVLQEVLPWLARRLALDEQSSYTLDFRLP